MGFFDRSIVEKRPITGGIETIGWDSDLSSVDGALKLLDFEVSGGSVTEAQAKAALSVDAGGLVFDTDAAEAAGASTDAQWAYRTKTRFRPGAQVALDVEVLSGAAASVDLRLLGALYVYDKDGAALTPDGGSSNRMLYWHGMSATVRIDAWGTTANTTVLHPSVTFSMTADREGASESTIKAFEPADNTFTSVLDSQAVTDPRGPYNTPLPNDAELESYLRVFRSAGTAGRLYFKIHRFQMTGATV